jgi:leucyl/phenylalanyl-tRNA---protein transferase
VHAPASTEIIDPELLLLAYRSGIFPMADRRDDPEIFWVEPRRRAILPLDGFHLSHSLARTLRRSRFAVTCNQAFAEVVEACSAPRRTDNGESWISERIKASYQNLHELGEAHSIECWTVGPEGGPDGERTLAGGLYGVGFDRAFCGESMFSRATDASKIALAWLVASLRLGGVSLLDCQFLTPHLASLGAVEISQSRYIRLLRKAQYTAGWKLGAYWGSGGGASSGGASSAGSSAGGGASMPGAAVALDLPDAFAALLAEAAASSSSPGNFISQLLTQTS